MGIFIIVVMLLALGALLKTTVDSESRSRRVLFGWGTFVWATLLFYLSGWVNSLSYNIWYAQATKELSGKIIEAMENGRSESAILELKALHRDLKPNYERRGNYRELVKRTVENLEVDRSKEGASGGENAIRPTDTH